MRHHPRFPGSRLRMALTVLAGLAALTGGLLWSQNPELSWAAPGQHPQLQTVPTRFPNPTREPPTATPLPDDTGNGDVDEGGPPPPPQEKDDGDDGDRGAPPPPSQDEGVPASTPTAPTEDAPGATPSQTPGVATPTASAEPAQIPAASPTEAGQPASSAGNRYAIYLPIIARADRGALDDAPGFSSPLPTPDTISPASPLPTPTPDLGSQSAASSPFPAATRVVDAANAADQPAGPVQPAPVSGSLAWLYALGAGLLLIAGGTMLLRRP
ncbi:MAG: hypothetical protein ACE5H9_02015 [Anaerolineae bacterium]